MNPILNRLEKIKTSKTQGDHRDSDSMYGHMSEIRSLNDFKSYPNLKKTNPQKFILNKGDCLIIPSEWWHHVTSYENTYGCNFWTSEKLSDFPILLKHEINFNLNDIENEEVYIWSSNKIYSKKEIDDTAPIKFKDFINQKKENQYFWTLKNYTLLNKNTNLCDKILNKIKIPKIILDSKQNFEFNIMACSKKHITPLHYDDEDGLLCVTEGTKEVIMFPKTDTENLYPIKFEKYKWKNSPAIDSIYNLYKMGEKIDGCSSARLLYETCKNNVGVLSSISKIIQNFHGDNNFYNKTIWGYKKIKNDYKWELYNYENQNDLKNNTHPLIYSYEIYQKRTKNRDYISNFKDEYYLIENNNEFYFGYVFRNDKFGKYKIGEYILDEMTNFKNNFLKYLERLNFNFNDFYYKTLNKYHCKYICIHQKNNNEFYIQHIGISNEDFLHFLIENCYDENLIDFYKKQKFNISNEITSVYDENFNIKRSAFYGIV